MKFGICGYGNLGQSVEKEILNSQDSLIGIFTRRDGVKSMFGTPIFSYDKAKAFKNEIDVMFMCGGSQEDLLWQSPEMLKYFNIIDTFDTHALIKQHFDTLKQVSLKSNKTAIYSCGWDPGLFSLMRALNFGVFGSRGQTFLGKGVSQGHSEALRNIKGVKDAIQFTVPNKLLLKETKNNPKFVCQENLKHERQCFVVLDGTVGFDEVVQKIKNTENYFKGQIVDVKEVSQEQLNNLKKQTSHKGVVFGGDTKSKITFTAQMKKNTDFTAKVMVAYARILKNLAPDVYSLLDIPLKNFVSNDWQKFV